MDRSGYLTSTKDGRNKCFTSSRADKAASWRSEQQARNNKNRDENMTDLDDVKFHPYPSPPLYAYYSSSSSFPSNSRGHSSSSNNEVQGTTNTSFHPPPQFHASNSVRRTRCPLPPPPGLLQVSRYEHHPQHDHFLPSLSVSVDGDDSSFGQQVDKYPYENSLLNQFEITKLTSSNNNSEDLFSTLCCSSYANNSTTTVGTRRAPSQVSTSSSSWMPLVGKRPSYTPRRQESNAAASYTAEKKKSLYPIGVKQERQTAFTTWSSVVAKDRSPSDSSASSGSAAALRDSFSVTAVPQHMIQYGGEQGERKPTLSPINTYPPSLSDISLYELDSQRGGSLDEMVVQQENRMGANDSERAASTKYISDSIGMITSSNILFSDKPSRRSYTVIKVRNLPYNSAIQDVERIFKRYGDCIALPDTRTLPQCVHFIMDIKTGKTCGVCFVEVTEPRGREGLVRSLSSVPGMPLQGRTLKLTLSSYDELCNSLFIYWKGIFKGGLADPSGGMGGPRRGDSELFIGQRDLQKLLDICRNYKANYNRKCPERPFEYLMSVALNVPWLQPRTVCIIQRDILYECYKLATDALRYHTCKQIQTFDDSLLERLIRVALLCDGFTVKQKVVILNTSRLPCPIDLENKIEEPEMSSRQLLDGQLLTLIDEE